MNYFLKANLCHDANHRARATDISGEADLAARVARVHDIFLVEDVLAEDTQLIADTLGLESPASREIAESIAILRQLRLVAVLEVDL